MFKQILIKKKEARPKNLLNYENMDAQHRITCCNFTTDQINVYENKF